MQKEIPKCSNLARFMETLRRKDPHALGFIPLSGYDQAINRGRVIFEYENETLCGFCLWARTQYTLRVHQIAIVQDARRLHHATELIVQLIDKKENFEAKEIILKCADDLESNCFWKALGFETIEVLLGGKTRKPRINLNANPHYFAIHRALGMRTLRDVIGPPAKRRCINVYRLDLAKYFFLPCQEEIQTLTLPQPLKG